MLLYIRASCQALGDCMRCLYNADFLWWRAWNVSQRLVGVDKVFRTPRNHLVDLRRHFLWKVKTWKPRKLQFNEIFSWWFLMQVLISLKSVFETSVQQLIWEAKPRLVQTTCPGSGPNCLIWLVVGVSKMNMTKLCEMNLSSWTFTSLQQGLHSRFHLWPDIVIPGPHVHYLVPLWSSMYLSFIYSWAV